MNNKFGALRGRRTLPLVGRRPVSVSEASLVRADFLQSGRETPVVLRPAGERLDLAEWAANNRQLIDSHLDKHGAILFRGFDVRAVHQFEEFVRSAAGSLLEYYERSSPRHAVGDRVYTATDHPPTETIFLHNEHSYSLKYPMRIFFYCKRPATSGGETPIGDCRRVLRNISEATRERFKRDGYTYVRNYGTGFGLTWQTVYQTRNRGEVEAYCRENGIEYEWKGEGELTTRQARPVITRHPRTGEEVWFNHATFFHYTTLEAGVREEMLREFREEGLPNNTTYGDGAKIEDEVMEELREAYRREKVEFKWERGDVLMLDNVLTAHGRNPFSGPREVLVAMAQPINANQV
jgi:alpha-ketoglutarate-dependent taurine dioxygenase